MERKELKNQTDLLADIKSVKKKMIKLDLLRLSLFLSDLLIFLTIIGIFITNIIDYNIKIQHEILSYFILVGATYILIKFPATLFFFVGSYYQKIIIFEKELIINHVKLKIKKEINYKSINFMLAFVVINVISAIILNDEATTFFQNYAIVRAFITTSSILLLTPSFVAALNNIHNLKQNTLNQYKVLIRNQFLANVDLFKDYMPINNFECIKFKNLEVTSKRGTLLLANYEDATVKKEIIAQNEAIIKIYHDLWKTYCDYLFLINSTEKSKVCNKYRNFNIQNFFDTIFIDFFDF